MPRSPIYPDFLTGRHLYALFLTLVSGVNQELDDKLHDGILGGSNLGLSIQRKMHPPPDLNTILSTLINLVME
jgi:hypothetical protein